MSDQEKAILEIQDELMQQKDTLLKDIRVIQKRKIKEMEELYDIKLKKKAFEIEQSPERGEMKNKKYTWASNKCRVKNEPMKTFFDRKPARSLHLFDKE